MLRFVERRFSLLNILLSLAIFEGPPVSVSGTVNALGSIIGQALLKWRLCAHTKQLLTSPECILLYPFPSNFSRPFFLLDLLSSSFPLTPPSLKFLSSFLPRHNAVFKELGRVRMLTAGLSHV